MNTPKSLVRAGAVLVAVLALTGCERADGFTEEAERQYTIDCLELGGELREIEVPEVSAQCVFTFPDLPSTDQ